MVAGLIGAFAALFLWAYFRAVEANWPQSYFAISDVVSQRVSTRAWRYALFRYGPVLLAAAFAAVTSSRAGGSGLVAGITTGLLHASMTSVSAATRLLRRKRSFARRSTLFFHGVSTGGIVLSAWLGTLAGSTEHVRRLVPELNELRSDIWTALFAGVIGAYFVVATRGTEVTASQLALSSRERIDPELVRLARLEATNEGADPDLAEAILLVENLQRPKWFRQIERAVGRIASIETYGIMQVKSKAPISDRESIELAIRDRLAGRKLPVDRFGRSDYARLRDAIRAYNGNERFVELVEEIYWVLRSQNRE